MFDIVYKVLLKILVQENLRGFKSSKDALFTNCLLYQRQER